MTILIILAAWILVLSLVAGLCLAARRGDVQLEQTHSRAERSEAPRSIVIPPSASARRIERPEPAGDLVTAAGATR